MMWTVVALILGFAALVGLLIWYGAKQAAKLLAAMEALAAKNGWTLRRDDRHLPREMHGFQPFGVGERRKARWVFEGQVDGVPFIAMDYEYITTSTDGKGNRSEHRHRFQVATAIAPMDGHNLTISPENMGHKIFDALGGEDIDFESDEFSRRFWVKCDDRRFAYDVITPRVMDYLLPNRRWQWQWRGRRVVLHRSGSMKVEDVEPLVQLLSGFLSRLPSHRLADRAAP